MDLGERAKQKSRLGILTMPFGEHATFQIENTSITMQIDITTGRQLDRHINSM